MPRVTKYKSKRGPNRSTLIVRGAFFNLNFHPAEEWVKAFRELEDPKDKIEALQKAFDYIYPKMGPISAELVAEAEKEQQFIEMEPDEEIIEEQATDKLLEILDKKT